MSNTGRRGFMQVVQVLGHTDYDLAASLGYVPASPDVHAAEMHDLDQLIWLLEQLGMLGELGTCAAWSAEVLGEVGVLPKDEESQQRASASLMVLFTATLVHLARAGVLREVRR